MKRISLRDFQLKPTNYISDLPVVLTRYGKDVAQVIRMDDLGTTFIPPKKEVPPSVKNPELLVHPRPWGFCQHHWEKGASYVLKECRLEDTNGDIMWEKKICEKCITRISSEVKRNGGVFFVGGVRYDAG